MLTDRALLEASKPRLIPSIDELVDYVEFFCKIPLMPPPIQARATTSCVEDVVEEAVSSLGFVV